MPVFAIVKLDTIDSRIIQEKYNLEDFSLFTRGTIKNAIRAMIREISERSKKTSRFFEVKEKLSDRVEIKILAQIKGDTRVVVITDGEYSSEIARQLVVLAFSSNDYEALIKKYKTWEDKDLLKKIEEELNKCSITVVEGLSQVLERGESLSELVDKSEKLSSQTKILFKTAKRRNRCC